MLKRWRWLDDLILPLTLLALRAVTFWLWLAVAQAILLPALDGPLLPVWLIVALLGGSTYLTRLLNRAAVPLRTSRIILAAIGVALLATTTWWRLYAQDAPFLSAGWPIAWSVEMIAWEGAIPPSYLLLPAFIYLWLRGIVEGGRLADHATVSRAFVAGTVGLVLLILITAFEPAVLPKATPALVLLFFMATMLGLALAGYRQGRLSRGTGPGAAEPGLNRYWLGTVLTIIGAVLTLSVLASALVAPRLLTQVANATWDLVAQVLILIIKVVSFILYPVLLFLAAFIPEAVRTLQELFDAGGGGELPNFEDSLPPVADNTTGLLELLETMPDGARWVVLAVFLLFLALLFALVVRRLSDDEGRDFDETREFILSRQLLHDQLAPLWPGRGIGPRPLRFLSLAGEPPTRRAIRALYRNLLTGTHKLGYGRARNETPTELADALAARWPAGAEDLASLTNRYLQARYDERPPTTAEADEARRRWTQLADFADGRDPEAPSS